MPESLEMTTVLVTLLAVVVALLVVIVAGLVRGQARILQALHDLDPTPGIDARATVSGAARVDVQRVQRPAVDVVGTTVDGEEVSIRVLDAPRPTILVFLTTTCTTCTDAWRALADTRPRRAPGAARVVVVTKGPELESRDRVRTIAPSGIPVVMSTDAWDAYGVTTAPRFACIDGDSGIVVCEGAGGNWDRVIAECEDAGADVSIAT